MDIATVINAFLKDRQDKGCTAGTIRTYMDQLRLFSQWCAEHSIFDLDGVRERHLQRYFSDMRSRPNRKWKGPMSPVTIQKRAIGLRTFFLFAKQRRLIKQDLAKRIQVTRGGRRRPKALSPEMVRQFLDISRWRQDEHLLADYTLILFLLDTGLRLTETCNLRIADVDFARGLVTVRSGKWDNDRGTVMLNETSALLREYVGSRAAAGDPIEMPVFSHSHGKPFSKKQIYRLVKRRAKQAKLLKEVCPHKLRHTWLTEYLNNGGRIHTASDLAGHNDVNTTLSYARTVSLVPVQKEHHRFSAVRNLVNHDIMHAVHPNG